MIVFRMRLLLRTFNFVIIVLFAHGYVAAYEFTTLASFPGGELMNPNGALATDGTYLYGTAEGSYPNGGAAYRVKLDGSGLVAIHYLNDYFTGFNPYGGVTVANSQLFGVTYRGGPPASSTIGSGTVFSMNLDGSNHQILRTFGNAATPTSWPHETVTVIGSTLYGTTFGQLSYDVGAVYSVNTDGTNFQFLHKFDISDGSNPVTRLQLIGNKLYGATAGFAYPVSYNGGTIFSINTDGTDFQLLHALADGEGFHVEGDLALVAGKLYGVTTDGGASNGGTIFRVDLDGTGFQTIHAFPPNSAPQSGLLFAAGKLFGTTSLGNTIFSIDPDGSNFQTVHEFVDAQYPVTRLLAIGSTLYGTTERGGSAGYGTLFALTIPEPSSIFLLLIAGFGMKVRNRRICSCPA
jgi:uncharacterized repeat protein (TIGR03803 family)